MKEYPMVEKSFVVQGKVEGLYISYPGGTHVSSAIEKVQLIVGEGVRYDRHCGVRLADVREKEFCKFAIAKGTSILNYRQWSALSKEENAVVAEACGIPEIPAGLLGENFLFSGIPNITQLPVGTVISFGTGNEVRTAALYVCGANGPCATIGQAIQERFPNIAGFKANLVKHAMGRRGIVGCVFSSGIIKIGDIAMAHVPEQHMYPRR